MQALSGLDGAFLHLETPSTPMHVASLHLFDLPPGYRGDFHADIQRLMRSRVHLASVFRRKLAPMPLQFANPLWVEDDAIDLDYHVQRVTLPPPGTQAQLGQNFAFGPKTPLNAPITGERGFAAVSIPPDTLRRLAAAHEAKLNDIVLALCSGALRRYLSAHGGVPRMPLIAAMPPVANVVISNVPGPQVPLYAAGARMASYWPLSIVEHGLGVNLTVMSYAGAMGFGFTTARSAVPDAREVSAALLAALDELVARSRPSSRRWRRAAAAAAT